MKIVIPMSGAGRRFIEAGYKDPKPLIRIAGKPMIQYVVEMYSGETDFVFICNNKHLATSDMRAILTHLAPHGRIIGIDKEGWDGPVPDILAVKNMIADDEPVLVSYCDFTVQWSWEDFKHTVTERDYDGAIIAYKGFHPHHFGSTYYGYMRVDAQKMLLEIKEKEPFTSNRLQEYAAAGSYYFKSGAILKRYFQEAIERDMRTGREFYASLPYNLMVRDGLKIFVYEVPKFIQFGTPHDVQVFQYWAEYFNRNP